MFLSTYIGQAPYDYCQQASVQVPDELHPDHEEEEQQLSVLLRPPVLPLLLHPVIRKPSRLTILPRPSANRQPILVMASPSRLTVHPWPSAGPKSIFVLTSAPASNASIPSATQKRGRQQLSFPAAHRCSPTPNEPTTQGPWTATALFVCSF